MTQSLYEKLFRRPPPNVSASNQSVAALGDINAPITIGVNEEKIQSILSEQSESFTNTVESKLAKITGISDETLIRDTIDAQLDKRIDDFGELIKQRKVKTALDLFKKLLEKEASKASARILFRIKANIGICELYLGKETEAANYLLEAYNFAPTEPKAISNKIIGLLLRNKIDEALEFGKKSLAEDDTNDILAGYLVQASKLVDNIENPLTLIPEKLHNTASVLTGYITFLIHRKDKSSWAVAHKAISHHPKDETLKLYDAEATLDEIFNNLDFTRQHHISNNKQKQKAEKAAMVLQEFWNKILNGENYFTAEDISICLNLLTAYRLLNKHEEIQKITNQVIEKNIEELNLFEQIIQFSIDYNNLDIAEKFISQLPDRPQSTNLKFQFYISKNNWQEIANISEEQIQALPSYEQPMISTTVKLAKYKNSDITTNELNHIFEDAKQDARACIVVAKFSEEFGFDDIATQAYQIAFNLVDNNSDYSSRLMVASHALHQEKWQDVISLLHGYIDITCDSHELRNLTLSFINNRPIQEKAVRFFKEIPKELLQIHFYICCYGLFHFCYGELNIAEKWLVKAFESDKHDLGLFLPLLEVYRENRKDEAYKLIQNINIKDMRGRDIEKIQFVFRLKEYGRVKEASEYIYNLRNEHKNNPNIVLGYFNFFMFSGDKIIPTPQYVEVDCWVLLKNQTGEENSFIISKNEDINSITYDLNHFFSKNIIGLKIGESFIQKRPIGGDITWTVCEIKHKYLYVLHNIMQTFEQRFPDFHGLYQIKIINEDISPLLEEIKKHSEEKLKITKFYLEDKIPLSIVANFTGGNAINFSNYIRSLGNDIITCLGTVEERTVAINLLNYQKTDSVVLDTYTVWIIAVFDIFDILKSVFKKILIPQSVLDEIKLIEIESYPNNKEKMSIGWNNNQYTGYDLSIEECEAIAANVKQLRQKIENNCHAVPVAVPDEIENPNNILEFKNSLDAIFLAQKEKTYLLSEDFYYRQFFSALAKNQLSLWLQPLMMYALEQGIIDKKRYAEVILKFATWKHSHLSITADILLTILENDNTEKLIEFSAVADYIGGKNAELSSHFNVVDDFLFILWSDKNFPFGFKTRKATGILLEKFIRVNQWTEAFVFLVYRHRTSRELMDYLDKWMKGHFLPQDKLNEAFLRLFPKK